MFDLLNNYAQQEYHAWGGFLENDLKINVGWLWDSYDGFALYILPEDLEIIGALKNSWRKFCILNLTDKYFTYIAINNKSHLKDLGFYPNISLEFWKFILIISDVVGLQWGKSYHIIFYSRN